MIVEGHFSYFSVSRKQSWARDNFLASRQRQRNNVHNRASGTSQGPEKIRKIVRPQCLLSRWGVATTNRVKWQLQTTLFPETWSHCRDRIVGCPPPSSVQKVNTRCRVVSMSKIVASPACVLKGFFCGRFAVCPLFCISISIVFFFACSAWMRFLQWLLSVSHRFAQFCFFPLPF